MMKRRLSGRAGHLPILATITFLWALPAVQSLSRPDMAVPDEVLDQLLLLALKHSPEVAAARERIVREVARHEGLQGFFDPGLRASTGLTQGPGTIPATSSGRTLPGDAISAQAGVETPLRPGAYLSAGVSQRYLTDTLYEEDLYQSVAGIRLGIPLIKDRGFINWRLEDRLALRLVRAEQQRYLFVVQQLRRDVTRVYAAWLQSVADARELERSAERVEALLAETEARVRLQVTPAYQTHAARADVALRREEARHALHTIETEKIRLHELLGAPIPDTLAPQTGDLVAWAQSAGAIALTNVEAAATYRCRGDYLEQESRIMAREDAAALAREQVKSDLSLALSAYWQGESEDGLIGSEELETDPALGAEVALVWRRPWGLREEKARARAAAADVQVARAAQRRIALGIDADVARATDAFSSARDRLALVLGGVADARNALDAEDERFRLGEGRSRNVLDAQKELTAAIRRSITAAADVVRAYADWIYATGDAGRPPALHLNPQEAQDGSLR